MLLGLQDKIQLVPIDLWKRLHWYKEKVYPKNKTCPPQINNTSQSSSSLNNNNNNNNNRDDENREVKQQSDHYLKQLNRASHKISKPIRRPPPPPLEPRHQQQQQDPQQQKQHQPPKCTTSTRATSETWYKNSQFPLYHQHQQDCCSYVAISQSEFHFWEEQYPSLWEKLNVSFNISYFVS
ncbi:hypothetical protein Syun_018619 [Stephania yunnanensis]|uniref:Uncharacterized protein n=1 Tax=Stephania yunnanensis TaxID=152371 RepID=A0AAP0ISK3_9MAGN